MPKLRVKARAWGNITYNLDQIVDYDPENEDPFEVALDVLLEDIDLDYDIIHEDK